MKAFEIKYKELTEYLKTLDESDFERPWNENKNPPIKICHLADGNTDKTVISADTFVDFRQPFLCDAIGNDLSVLINTKRGFKLPTGRVVNAKFDTTLISDCRKIYGTPLNGCWVIPPRFLIIR